ncbi:Phenylacrylic acid decarboxylase [mine drainage metagenome]|uniref:Phenylacrylic acid decarboxylase n=1 Tax=mine drainage metagenome TaxID=410659 RepID=T1APK4_9ZZZZ
MTEAPPELAATPAGLPPIVVGVSGASGAVYGLELIARLLDADREVDVIITDPARTVIEMETGLILPAQPQAIERILTEHLTRRAAAHGRLRVFGDRQWTAPMASGSARIGAMAICPCSMGTLSAVATGASHTLLERAADVMIKERRRLVLVPRETPLSAIHLAHMLHLSQSGVIILPASPGFYHTPVTVGRLIDFIVARTLDHLGIDQHLMPTWG